MVMIMKANQIKFSLAEQALLESLQMGCLCGNWVEDKIKRWDVEHKYVMSVAGSDAPLFFSEFLCNALKYI